LSQIPSIISDYSASDAGDIARLVACFSNRATVVDEGRTYEGATRSTPLAVTKHAEIRVR